MTGGVALWMFLAVCVLLMAGYPVAFTLAGTAIAFASLGIILGHFDPGFLGALPGRVFGTMSNGTLVAVPLFIIMGTLLEKSRIAEKLLVNMARAFGRVPGGLALSVLLVGTLLAASTGIVGATVVTMGLLSLPAMLSSGYRPAIAAGTICATGTLGQIIPPSIALVLLGDILSSAYQQAQLAQNDFTPDTLSVGDLFVGALLPGLCLVGLYAVYLLLLATARPGLMPRAQGEPASVRAIVTAVLPPLLLVALVLGSIIAGAATPTEAAGVGATGALVLALLQREMSMQRLQEVLVSSLRVTAMVFMILIGAAVFSLVFRGFGGEELIQEVLGRLPGGAAGATLAVMALIFLLGFILDFIEITFVVVPIVGPVLLMLGVDPIWLGVMIAINLQTSFLTPPFGFALFYLRGVAPPAVSTAAIYRGVIPFVAIQLVMLVILWFWPELATWLPNRLDTR